jgi:polyhydroxyalkanoate synthase
VPQPKLIVSKVRFLAYIAYIREVWIETGRPKLPSTYQGAARARDRDADSPPAVAALGPEAPLFIDNDPELFGKALAAAALGAARRPLIGTSLALRLGANLMSTGVATMSRLWGMPAAGPMQVDPKDKRFADPAWEENPAFWALRQAYLAFREYGVDLVRQAELDLVDEGKAELALSVIADALSPTNFPATNPAVVKRAFETSGRSLVDGFRNFVDDLVYNNGRPKQVDTSPFEVGRNLACTPAKVVYRSPLIEVLQYLPQTETVHQVPLLCSPPWINKYYIMDLAPGRSFIEWAVQQGRTVFAISYRNPDASMSRLSMDDYLINGPKAALDIVCEITGGEKVDIVGLCLGGTLTMMTACYLDEIGDDRINNITLLNTMVDFSDPGILGRFTDEQSVAKVERKMARRGFLEGSEMAGTFDMLRANDLIFNYVVANWLMGKQPPAFDILAWNSDSTRMPATMHSFYLRSCYVRNEFARGELELAGQVLDLEDIKEDLYIVAAINDHIVPWMSSYATIRHVGGDVRFGLSSGGHIAGIVNPPGSKSWYQTADHNPDTAEDWRAAAQRHQGSWWEDWARWGAERAGPKVEPSSVGSDRHPVLGDGPGDYVHT